MRDRRKSLFSAGIVRVTGEFNPMDAVHICDEQGLEIGRGLSNYASDEVLQLMVGPSGFRGLGRTRRGP